MKKECRGKTIVEKDNKSIIDCEICGYFHAFPMYEQKELEDFYKDVYSESTPSYLMHEKVYNIQKWKDKGTVLDIGCWEGTQLDFFAKQGWKCSGIELNKKAAAVASSKGISVKNISIQQFFDTDKKEQWDVINVAYILEHIPEPEDFLEKIKSHIKKDGIIIIEVPNEFNPLQLAYIKEKNIKPYWIALPDHLNYFTKESIGSLLHKTGWNILHGESSFPMEMFLLMGDDYLSDNSIGRKSFKKVVKMEENMRKHSPDLVSTFYSALYHSNIGRSITLYAQLKK